jgi:hypothetical protein
MERTTRLDLEVKYENYWNILRQNHEMIRFSELKAGFIISVYGIVFSLLLGRAEQIKDLLLGNPVMLIVGILFFAATVISFGYSLRCFIPRFENKNPTSIIYFGDIVNDFDDYHAYFDFVEKNLQDEEAFSLQLAEQIHTNAGIATKKFRAVTKSIRFLLLALLILACLLILMMVI